MAKKPATGGKHPVDLVEPPFAVPALSDNELQDLLRKLQKEVGRLFNTRMAEFLEAQPEKFQREFNERRGRLALLVERLVDAGLERIVGELRANEDALEAATSNLKREQEKLENIVRIIKVTGDLINIASRIIAIVGL